MKKSGAILISAFVIMLLTATFIHPAKAPAPDPPKGIPDSVWAIVERCCLDCHVTDGNGFAKAKLNFDKWDVYPAEKQVAKATAICDIVKKGKMPPQKFLTNNPDAAPTEAETARICNWVNQLKK
ncbi:MAG: heme-binding domain-containing protein [bacterium]